MVIDQHAAHERVLYERAVARFDGAHAKTQQLLFPHTIEMTPGDVALINQLNPLLERLGFSLKIFGKTSIVLDGVPIDVKPGDEKGILPKILDLFKEDEHTVKLEPRERLAKSFSCKAAIKAGDPLKDAEMHSLLDQLFATEIPYVCPHGRPVIIKFSLSELDRRFGRTS
jgi:DNA mismatch repair protein MutL